MNKRYTIGSLAIGLMLALALTASGDIIPTNSWKMYYGEALYNGQLAPIGSVIDTYDPDGVRCGTFTVGDLQDIDGLYGAMPVYGDDPWSPDFDEGANQGDLITFKLNHRDAQVTVVAGDIYWDAMGMADIDLSVNDAIIDLTMTDPPSDRIGFPFSILQIPIGLRNDGNGLDFYTVEAVSTKGWTLHLPTEFTYAAAGETVFASFAVETPLWAGSTESERIDTVDFAVYSELDPSQRVEGRLIVEVNATNVYAIELTDPPIAKEGEPDNWVPFFVGVRNVGNDDDEYSIEVTSDLDWVVRFDTTGLVNAAPGEEVYLAFEVLIPSDAADAADLLTYIVVSSGDPGVSVGGEVLLTSQTTTGVDDNGVALLPNSLQLAQNYPNPFNPTTTISYTLPSRSRVSLDIYDVLGRVVEHIDLGAVSGGTHDVEYDASSLSSGVYFYRLATDFGAETRKMVLLK